MVRKLHKSEEGETAASRASTAQLAGTVKESAQQIWLAGLGAFSKAQEEGGKVFEALVKEGVGLQRKTQAAAEGKLNEAGSRMASMATELSSKASGQWDKLENIFEERVARALKKLGVPTAKDVEALTARVEELNRTVARMNGTASPARRAAKAPASRIPVKAPRKTTARKTAK
jgi:poly(hydroxyalkanoate) granule-associated protein